MNGSKILGSYVALLILIVTFSFSAHSQNATIRGVVYDKSTGEPVIFANVLFVGKKMGTSTDVNGIFTFTKLQKGVYEIMIKYEGYEELVEKIEVTRGDEIIQKKFYIKETVTVLRRVDITAKREENLNETKTSIIKITPKQLKQLPTIGGQADLAQYMQVVPGVIFSGDQGGQLYIRGGSPIQNKVLLDGMIVYNPFHSIGLFSVFETDILKNIDVYTGGFGAEFGGRISSVMNITTRDGNKRRLQGKVGASVFGATALLEGPLSKNKKNDETGNSSFIISYKNSYLKQTSKKLYEYANEDGLPFNFNDIYGKMSFNSGNGGKLNIFGFNFNDKVTGYQSLADYGWNNMGIGADFLVIPGTIPMVMEGIVSYSSYKITMKDQTKLPKFSKITNTTVGLNFTYFIKKNEMKYGIDFQGGSTDLEFYNVAKKQIKQQKSTTEVGFFVKYKWNLNSKLILEPGLRGVYYASLSNFSPEPRLALKYNLKPNFRLKAATGIYSQNLIDSRSDRDIVNLFSGYLSTPDNLPKTYKGENIKNKLQKAEHIVGGIEYDLNDKVSINFEGYFKNFSQLINVNRDKLYDDNVMFESKPDYLKKEFIIEKGNAYGAEMSIKYDFSRISLWTVYSLGFVNREDEIRKYVTSFDRRHNVNVVLSYTLGEHFDWQVDLRWNYGSGFPFTQLQGAYEKNPFEGGLTTDYITDNGELGYLYADINKGRLPDYHRLDLSVKKKWFLSDKSILEAVVSVTNAYNRKNIFYYDVQNAKIIYQLPIMPSFGLYLTF